MFVRRVDPDAFIPVRVHPTDAGLDLFANEYVEMRPHSFHTISTGVAIQLPPNTCGQIWARSGLASGLGIQVLGGLVDEGYTGEIKVVLATRQHHFTVQRGDRIAQLVVSPVLYPEVRITHEFDGATPRGETGFGNSGV